MIFHQLEIALCKGNLCKRIFKILTNGCKLWKLIGQKLRKPQIVLLSGQICTLSTYVGASTYLCKLDFICCFIQNVSKCNFFLQLCACIALSLLTQKLPTWTLALAIFFSSQCFLSYRWTTPITKTLQVR